MNRALISERRLRSCRRYDGCDASCSFQPLMLRRCSRADSQAKVCVTTMTPERWQKVKEIFQSAIQRAPGERSAFLASACGGDEALRSEVESLIASHEKSGEFIDSPAYEAAAEMIVDDKAELKPGQTIGTYEILSFISRGGMGEVYLAQDRRLSRKVALEDSSRFVYQGRRSLAPFRAGGARGFRSQSSQHHHDLRNPSTSNSTHMIATEFVEGETLRKRLFAAIAASEAIAQHRNSNG